MDTRKFYCYLDHFDELTIIVPLKNYRDNTVYTLIGNDELIELKIIQKHNIGTEVKLVCQFDAYIHLEMDYHIKSDEGETSELYTGKIVRTDLFDNIYHYKKNDLGFTYTKESTKFKVWTPVAKVVTLELVSPKGVVTTQSMIYQNLGVWRLVIDRDLEGYRYRYHVYVNGKTQILTDPYGIASNANAEYNYIVDLSKTYQMKHNASFSGHPSDAIIYELHVRDFTIDSTLNFKHPGQYLGLTEKNIKTKSGLPAGIDYLKSLGVTHVQLMPVFDFDGIDELHPNQLYNWGYNPRQYNVPSGWFSTDPNDPYARINELKQMIDTLHEYNINVVMDVVYNHVFDAEVFPFEKLVPGYAYHVDREGIYTNVSGCHNDLATHRKMVRKFIIDSVLYWTNEYKIDGFRFDLMGLIDTETMNELRQELHNLDEHLLVYGEGWKMYSSNTADRMAHMGNKTVIYTIGFFNDRFRETVKGATFFPEIKGYATGRLEEAPIVKEMLLGSAHNRFMFKYATQSVNYVECHDNRTFFDKCLHITEDISLIKKQQKLATSMVLLSQGVPFIHSGQEFYRTKQDDENSYRSGDEINKIDWSLYDENFDDVSYIQSIIELRKTSDNFKLKASSELDTSAEVIVLQSKSILYKLTDGDELIILFKPTELRETIIIPEDYRFFLSSSNLFQAIDAQTYEISDIGTYIFKK
ncbi:MAG: type I pullulanase [Tenericutes bacterium HGW-Tenericutes-3]|nr:MAG: type I pullulanase [Tenericutes bacterium HGW-Tenericutes-3]